MSDNNKNKYKENKVMLLMLRFGAEYLHKNWTDLIKS